MDNLSIYDFFKCINTYGNIYTHSNIENIVIVYPTIDAMDESKSEEYNRQQCILQIPFRTSIQNFYAYHGKDSDDKWFDYFESQNLTILNADLDYRGNKDLEEDEIVEDCDIIYNAFEMLSAAKNESPEQALGQRYIDVAHDWKKHDIKVSTITEIEHFLQTYKFSGYNCLRSNNMADVTLSKEQNEVIELCQRQIDYIKNNDVRKCTIIKRIIVQGKAGSGKSTIINKIMQLVIQNFGREAIAITAPTGVAAINIGGNTIHTQFSIPIKPAAFSKLENEPLRKFQTKNKGLKFIIMDEMSMIGARLLHHIESRCSSIFPNASDEFGGLFVYMFGDFRQLPPVKDTALYSDEFFNDDSLKGSLIFDSFEHVIELSVTYRQNNDKQFSDILERVAYGEITNDDYNTLSARRYNILDKPEQERFNDAIYIFPTNDEVKLKNEECLRRLNKPVLEIKARNVPNVIYDIDEDTGLLNVLHIAIGCRIMLTYNTWVEGGLANASLGTVRAVIFDDDTEPPQPPRYILVQFDNYDGPCVNGNLFPVEIIVRSCEKHGRRILRYQFPLKLAYAITIHKSQGLTIPIAKMDLGNKEFASGLTYVLLSRVKNLTDLVFTGFQSKQRFDSIAKSKATKLKLKFLHKLHEKRLVRILNVTM